MEKGSRGEEESGGEGKGEKGIVTLCLLANI